MKKIISFLLFIAVSSAMFMALRTVPAAAFNGNNLMDDIVFDSSGAMNATQINSWLNTNFPNSCISPNSGFEAKVPNGYSPSTGFTFGGFASAGEVISAAAQAYGINPQVLLVTLQKEQSLVAGGVNYCNDGSEHKYAAAMGYGCPDGGTVYNWSGVSLYRRNGMEHTVTGSTCVNTAAKAGFSQQIIRAAWLLKFGEQRSEGNTAWAVIKPGWDNSDDPPTCYSGPMTQGYHKRCSSDSTAVYYDGFITIDSTSTHMDTGATAALYWYTPHFHGNQNFDDSFQQWFGSIYGVYAWYTTGYKLLDAAGSYYADPGNLQPGQRYLVDLAATNTGTATWTNSGFNPVRLGTTNPDGHSSILCDSSWIGCNRPVTLREAAVAPGEVGHFNFLIQVPYVPGTYREYFKPLAELLRWMNSSDQSLGIRVASPGTYNWFTTGYKVLDQNGGNYMDPGNLSPNTKYLVDMAATNTGTATWVNSGPTPVRLGTNNPVDHSSPLCDSSWLWCSRPVSLRESSVAPGQVGHFDFLIQTPSTTGSFREYYKPLAEIYTWMNDSNQSLGIIVK